MTAKDVVDARKTRIDEKDAWEPLKTAISAATAKVRKVLRFDRVVEEKEAILQQVMGPGGNLRAPALRVGDAFIVGFNPELYAARLK